MTPAFITLTGADKIDLIPGMRDLSRQYDSRIEWGILFGLAPLPRFADPSSLEMLRRSGLRLAMHLCGPLADAVFAGQFPELDLSGFSRLQVNKPSGHATAPEVENAIRFGRCKGIRTILQCAGTFPSDLRADWLVDDSHGRGRKLSDPPALPSNGPLCGYSGGITPETIQPIFDLARGTLQPYWIDTESYLQDAGAFSLEACALFACSAFSEV